MRKLLIVRLGSLGDIVHALPVAAALRDRFPGARIDWLVDARYADVLRFVPVVDRRVVITRSRAGAGGSAAGPGDLSRAGAAASAPGPGDPSRAGAGDSGTGPGDERPAGGKGDDVRGGVVAVIADLRRQRYDAALDVQGLIRSAALARLSGARRVIGFDRHHLRERLAAVFYSETCDPGAVAHVVDKNLSMLAAFGVADRARRFPIDVPPSPAADDVRGRLAAIGAHGCVLLNPGAAWPNKRWPPERFGEIAAWLSRERGLVPVVVWGPGEEALGRAVVESSRGTAWLAPATGIGDVLALAREARLMLSGDTGPLHLAAAVGTPIVAVFGPTNPSRNGPWDASDISLSRFGDCVCQYRRRCRRSRACIEDISVEDVRGAIDRRLAATGYHA